ncbi:hypothetical protein EI555_021655, partial [Monodon monoceros]
GSNTSLVRLDNNGYEGIIIAIDPAVPEDETLIQQIKPDVLVSPPTLPGRDEPYTKQFTACEEKGEYIHFTPDFVLGKKQNEFGPSSITGINRVYKCQGNSCVTKRCKTDSKTNLYEKDCQFFPDTYQTEKTSIMFMQGIDSVAEFCNNKTHNREAPSLQNKMCNFRSTWEVISNSEDFRNTVVMVAPPPPPVFSLLKISERIVCLVLHKSGSMAGSNRLNRMNQAAKHFLLQTVENGSWVGMVHFDNRADTKSNLIQIISSNERRQLLKSLPTVASGGTSICSGIKSGFQVIRKNYSQIDGSEIVLLTDGEDSSANTCIDEVKQSGAIIHFIALGPNADKAVIKMSNVTGGEHFYASDEAQNNGLIDAFAALASGNTDASQQSLQLESKGLKLDSTDWMNGTVIIDSTVGKDTFFLITWNQELPVISLLDPTGNSVGNFTVDPPSKMAYLSIPGTTKSSSKCKRGDINYNMNAKMNKDTNSFPSPMIVYAEILQGYIPILGANVTAFIESNTGKTEVLELLDNGAGADSFKNDGVYSRYFTTYKENDRYSLKVRAHGGENAVMRNLWHPLNRAAYIPGWVVDGFFNAGNIKGNPPRPEIDENTQTNLESFTRIASGGAFVVSDVPNLPSSTDVFPPTQITDLKATSDEDEISLTWTAPGDDFDVGKVRKYIIRISGSILDLRDNFDDALQVNTTYLLPNEANSKETFTFKPGNISEENATHICIAIQSVDKSNLTSRVSNIAQAALFVPQAEYIPDEIHPDPTPDKNPPKSGLSISTLVVLVVGTVIIVSLILSITICVLSRKRNSSRPRTGF